MKKLLFSIAFGMLFSGINAQIDWNSNQKQYSYPGDPEATTSKAAPPKTFYEIQQDFYNYWNGKTPNKGEGYKMFKRWEALWEPQVYPTGNFPDLDASFNSFKDFQQTQQQQKIASGGNNSNQVEAVSNWTQMGPYGAPPSGTNGYVAIGSGRVNCIEFEPGNSNNIWIGTPAGGLWKSTDGGSSWENNASWLYTNGVSDIAIAPSNANIIYVATGDADEAKFSPSRGVFKSIDGGATWQMTGLTYNLSDEIRIFKLIVHPTNPNIAIAALAGGNYTQNGLWRTTDGGTTWNRSTWLNPSDNNPNYYGCSWSDLEFKPGDPNTVYASSYEVCNSFGVWKSTDGGATFGYVVTFPAGWRISLAVTPANPNVVYALAGSNNRGLLGVYKSTNSGAGFSLVASSPNMMNGTIDGSGVDGQGEYNNNITVDPTNENVVYLGSVNYWKSTNGGYNWNRITYWNQHKQDNTAILHADCHALEFAPNGSLFTGNDGGIYKSTDGGITWVDKNEGIDCHIFERIADSETDPGMLIGGTQDNSSYLLKNSTWKSIGHTGDGEDCIIDYADNNILYTSAQNGWLNKSSDGGVTYQNNIGPKDDGAWCTPIVMSNKDHNTIYAGYEKVYKTTNGMGTWSSVSYDMSGGAGQRIIDLTIDNSDTYFYAATKTRLFKSSNGASTWSEITTGLPVASAEISRVFVNPINGNEIWVTFYGYVAGQKVYYSSNGGSTWQNISSNLPNVQTLCILPDINSSVNAVYLGTSYAVFYKDNTSTDWSLFNTNMPWVPIRDLEINSTSGKLRAGTRGRGMWETDILTTSTPPAITTAPCNYLKKPASNLNYNFFDGGAGGYGGGHNKYGSSQFAEYHIPDGSYTMVNGVSFYFHKAVYASGASKITVKIWKNDGVNGAPGTVLASKDVAISVLAANANQSYSDVMFSSPIIPTTPYYVGYELYYAAGDTMSLYYSANGTVTPNTAWVFENNAWMDWPTSWGAGKGSALAAHPIVGTKPTVAFTANPTTSTAGSPIAFTNGSSGATAYKWAFTGGTPEFSVSANPSVTYAAAGTYAVKLVAYGSCNGVDSLTKSAYITIGAPSITGVVTNVSCNGGSNGAINVTVNGTNNTYSWSNGATTEDISGVVAGTYNVYVTSGASTTNASFTITQPAAMTATGNITDVSCNGGNNGAIAITVAGGTAPYTYLWSNGSTAQNVTGLTAGTYTLTVTATGGCSVNKSFTVGQPGSVQVALGTVTNATCGANNGTINISVTGGTAPYTYLWSNGATTQNITGLSAGTYTVTVTDSKGCTGTKNATITQPSSLTASVTSSSNVSCPGGSNGSINISVSGGTPNYTYLWSNGATTQNVSGLVSGTYTVAINDAGGCSFNTGATITQPSAITVSSTNIQNASCNGASNGAISIAVTGGNAPYTYLWTGGATTKDITGKAAGSYSVTVTTATGCTATGTYTIAQPTVLSATVKTITNVSCSGGSNGAIDVNVAGGTQPYSYAWSNSANTEDISGVVAGNYNLTLTDKNGCIATASGTITQPLALTAAVTSSVNPTCFGATNGSVNITANGGTAPYTYLWSSGATTEDLSNVGSGPYNVTITDNKSCSSTTSAYLNAAADLAITLVSSTNPTCNGFNNGSINVSVTGGTAPYTYAWTGGATTEDLNNVGANSYTLTVTSVGGCTKSASYTLTQPSAMDIALNSKINVLCNGGNNGAIDISVTGGTSPYTYSWSNGVLTQDVSNLISGNYSVTVKSTDANCSKTATYQITQPAPISITSNLITNATCGSNNGAVDINVAGGTSPYTYSWSTGATSQDITLLSAGNYTVNVKDANNCSSNYTASVTQPGSLTITVDLVSNVTCKNGTNGAANITVTGGTAGYTYSWSNGATSEDVTGLMAGTHSVTVTDGSSCQFTKSITVTEPALLVATISSSTNVSCNGGTNGAVDLTVTGGTAPYTYTWSNGAVTQDLTSITANSYNVTVTSMGGCTATASTTVNEPMAIDVSTLITNVNCNGGSNGAIDATVSGGNAPYTYSWNTGAATQDLSGVMAGNYSLKVTDNKGCIKNSAVVVSQPQAIAVTVNQILPASCNLQGGGAVDVSVSGGVAPYAYTWSNFTSTQDLTNVNEGAYTLTVRDSLLCIGTKTVTVTKPAAVSIAVNSKKDVSCNGGNNGTISIDVTGGMLPYAYMWNTGATTKDLSGLTAGDYTISVNSGGGCVRLLSVTVAEPTALIASATTQDVICNGGNNGSVNLSVSGGTTPYSYLWNNNATTEDLTSLAAAGYSVTVKDKNNCTTVVSATVNQPSAIAITTGTVTNTSCGANNGAIDINVSGGTSPYTYAWNNGATTQDITSLAAGTFTVTVTDANNCSATYSNTVTQPGTLTATVTKTDITCNGNNNGSVNLSPTGGTTPYTYSWSNGATTEDLSNLAAGVYNLTLSDAGGCTYSTSATIINPAPIMVSATSNVSPSCNGGTNGSLSINISGGTSPYSYLWNNGATTKDLSTIAAGNYSVNVTDANGCNSTFSATVVAPTLFTAAIISQINNNCNGDNNGLISVDVSGSTAPYTFNWNNGEATQNLTNLTAGTYSLTAVSAKGCTATVSASITQPSVIALSVKTQTNVSCGGGNNGSIEMNIAGGTAPYTYLWSNGATTKDISSLQAGTYTLTATDSKGCSKTFSATITQSGNMSVSESITNVNCFGASTGAIDITVTGGTAPYTYLWSNSATTQDLTAKAAGVYSVTVTDAASCSAMKSFTITQNTEITIATVFKQDVSCNGGSDGKITVAASGGSGTYTYSWSSGGSTTTIDAMSQGNYTVFVTDGNGCVESSLITVSQPASFMVSTSLITNSTGCGNADGAININTTGGTSPYTYLWSNSATTEDLTLVAAGVYSLSAIDSKGCMSSVTATVSQPGGLSVTIDTQNDPTCFGGGNGSIELTVTGGSGLYTYLWSSGETTQDVYDKVAGTYTVSINDGAGCTYSQSVTLTDPSSLEAMVNLTSPISCNGASDGALTLSISGGTASYAYTWSTGSTSLSISGLSAGDYVVNAADANGCQANITYTLSEPGLFAVNAVSVTDASCYGVANGSIDMGVTGGTDPFTYSWSNGATSEDLSSIAVGSYTLNVTSTGGCTASKNVIISEPTEIQITESLTSVSVDGGNDGAADITVSGGNTPYSYLWTGGLTTEDISGLTAGTYTCNITDNNGCVVSHDAIITQPASGGFCSGTTSLTADTATFEDGSGYSAYGTNSNCYWYIHPANAAYVLLTFNSFATQLDNDRVIIYDGADTNAAVLATYSGNSIPFSVVSSTGEMLVRFVTDGSVNDSGWVATYYTEPIQAAFCSGTTNLSTPTGTFTDGSGGANYSNASNCSWLINPTGATSIVLKFDDFATEQDYDYITVYDGADANANVLAYVTGTNIPDSVVSSGGTMFVNFISDYAITDLGWTANYYMSTAPNSFCSGQTTLTAPTGSISDGSGSSNYGPNSDCSWLIQPANANSITLEFANINTEKDYDYVAVYDGVDTSGTLLAVVTGDSIQTITAYSGNMFVWFSSDFSINGAGFFANYSSTITAVPLCSGLTNLTDPSGTFEDASGLGTNYGDNSYCEWLIQPTGGPTSVTLNFNRFDTEDQYDYVYVYQGVDWSSGTLIASYTGSNLPASITALGGDMYVLFMSDNVINAEGWEANYVANYGTTGYCNGYQVLTTPTGTVTDGSGLYLNYGDDANCAWLIQPANATSITLDFTGFATEQGYDSVWVYDGANYTDPLLGGFTGNTLPPSITSTGGSMLIYFYSDNLYNDLGWEANWYSTIAPPVYCNGTTTLTAATDTFSDGSGTEPYTAYSSCSWLIQPAGASQVNLYFNEFDTESSYDFVSVYDGVDNGATLIGQFSGNALPTTVSSTGGAMFVEFTSDNIIQNQGWTAYYDTLTNLVIPQQCGGLTTLTDSSGYFDDGSLADEYTPNRNCKWLIQPAGASSITLGFDAFETESGYDFVRVYDGVDSTATLIGEYSGSSLPSTVSSSGGSMFVQFTSDFSLNGAGWEAWYVAGYNSTNCDMVITATGTNTTCDGCSDGSATVSVTGGTAPLYYWWTNGETTQSINGLTADTYWVYVWDSGICYDSAEVVITDPTVTCTMSLSALGTDATCIGCSDASIDLTVTGSTGTITYVWDNAEVTEDLTGVFAGCHQVTVTDGAGCIDTLTTCVGEPSSPTYCSGNVVLTAPSGTFNDGSGATDYQDFANCSWLIQPAGALSITLTFNDFATENGYDSVYVYDGANSGAALLGGYTGNTIPPVLTSTGGSMFVWFKSDNLYVDAGWSASYTSLFPYCSGTTTLTAASGSFDDGSGLNDYTNYSDCKWLIQPAGATSITLTFNSFDTETGYDSVYVYDGANSSATLLGGFTGNTLPPVLTSTGGSMFVWFKSDYLYTMTGWDASYTSTAPFCAGTTTLTASIGSFSDGSGTSDYNNFTDCKWLIQPSPAASSISLTFTSFDVEAGYDSVMVYDGANTTDPLLGTFTGNTLPPTLTSSGGSILVWFLSDNLITASGWSADYSSTVSIASSKANSEKVSIVPNPTSGQFTVSFAANGKTKVELVNVIGAKLYSEETEEKGMYQRDLNISDYSTGVYFLKVTTNKGEQIVKVVKQ